MYLFWSTIVSHLFSFDLLKNHQSDKKEKQKTVKRSTLLFQFASKTVMPFSGSALGINWDFLLGTEEFKGSSRNRGNLFPGVRGKADFFLLHSSPPPTTTSACKYKRKWSALKTPFFCSSFWRAHTFINVSGDIANRLEETKIFGSLHILRLTFFNKIKTFESWWTLQF